MRRNQSVRVGIGASLAFTFVRRLERILSPTALHRVMELLITARIAFKRPGHSKALPACLGEGKYFQMSRRQHRTNRLNAILEFFPEQLGTAKWLNRARFIGVEHLEAARQRNRPVVLAFFHFGPYFLLRPWLRAADFPVATVVKGRAANRSALKHLKDRASPFPQIPCVLHQEDQLREIIEFVSAGNVLLIALDGSHGKQIEVPVDEHWRFPMANGAIRLAVRQGAELIPCSILDQGGWRFQITLGPPVPPELRQSGDTSLAGKHVLNTMLPELRAHPEQCSERLLKHFQRVDSGNNSRDEFSRTGQFIAR